jgi:hypothetical protein
MRFVPAGSAGSVKTSTSPILFVPAGRVGRLARDTGCVACQNVPVTGNVPPAPVTVQVPAWVAWVANVPALVTAWDGTLASDTGCVACQNVPVTGMAPAMSVSAPAGLRSMATIWVLTPDRSRSRIVSPPAPTFRTVFAAIGQNSPLKTVVPPPAGSWRCTAPVSA